MVLGVEGGLLRSTDAKRFDFVLKWKQEDLHYPYIKHVLFARHRPGFMWVAGFDKVTQHAFIAESRDGGLTWTDLSASLPRFFDLQTEAEQITALVERSDGSLLIAQTLGAGHSGRLLLLLLR